MDVDAQNGPMNNCQSGSSIRPSSQRFPKVSIGIMVEKTPKMQYAAREEDETMLLVREMVHSSQEKNVEGDRGLGATVILTEKKALCKGKVSPWVSTRSVYHETPNIQAVCFHAKSSMLQSDGGLHEKLDTISCEKRREKSGNVERVEEIAFAAMQEMHFLHKGSTVGPAKLKEARSEALRMKLWEALGTGSSQNKHISSPQPANENANVSISENHKVQLHEVPKPRHDTDTIETDSENPNVTLRKGSPTQAARRPLTRSLARKKDPVKTLPNLQFQKSNSRKHLPPPRSELKQKYEENNISAFNDGEKQVESSTFAFNGHKPVSAQKKREMKSARVEPRRISFPSRSVSLKSLRSNRNLPSSDKERPLPPRQNEANTSRAVEGNQTFRLEVKDKNPQPSNSSSENFVHSKNRHLENQSNSSLANSSETRELDSPPLERGFQGSQGQSLSKDGHPHENVSSPTPAGRSKSLDHLSSLSFAANMTPSPPERKAMESGCFSPMLSEEKAPVKSFKSPLYPQACSSESVAHPETSDGSRDPLASPTGGSSPAVKGKMTEKCFSPSQVQPPSSESLETDEIIGKGFRKNGKWHSKTGDHSKSLFTLRHGKRVCSIDRKLDPSSAFTFNVSGTGEAIGAHCFLGQSPEDSLARAITQLAVVLERFKAKIKSHTCKKSSEILSSVGDRIHLQLQEVESLIHADTEKFISLGKSKRKRLESTFLEQQEKLKAIHEKFKEEINQHLLDCRSSLEELESYQEELKGNVERQKAAHRKLVLQLEEAMEARLAGAETSIAAVHKAARKKMEGLKHALRGWLTDDGTLH